MATSQRQAEGGGGVLWQIQKGSEANGAIASSRRAEARVRMDFPRVLLLVPDIRRSIQMLISHADAFAV